MLCKRTKGAAEIGIVVTTFFVFLFILLPLNLFVQELNYYRLTNQDIMIATEMACFDTVFHIDTDALSQSIIAMDSESVAIFEQQIRKTLKFEIDIQNLQVVHVRTSQPERLSIYFEYPYKSKFILKGKLTKGVIVKLDYELPLNNDN